MEGKGRREGKEGGEGEKEGGEGRGRRGEEEEGGKKNGVKHIMEEMECIEEIYYYYFVYKVNLDCLHFQRSGPV